MRKPKDKTSLWISAEVMDDYREWSWEEHCTLGELIERALEAYRRRRGRPRESGGRPE
ncbi:MAG: hypothetical protein KY475_20975 [Planctomycetes bacterium]|nr:hypothetical protein [Planctomycetota bacterium]